MAAAVTLTDVVLRDGLQDEPVVVPVPDRVAVARALAEAGVPCIEAASFVDPARVPQMAGAEELVAALPTTPGVRHSGIALNARGARRAIRSGLQEVTLVVSAGQGHSRANAGRDTAAALAGFEGLAAAHPSITFTAGVATAFVCPFDGPVPPERLQGIARSCADLGVERINLADTLGTATPEHVTESLEAVRAVLPATELALHLHDAHGQALRTVDRALALGVTRFDSALGGYGGCPFAPGAHGNLATEGLVAHLHARGVRTGIDVEHLSRAASLVREVIAAAPACPR
ncbi:hydroxymethylglutaryl-CoA lyase [Nocardiopsis sp. HNM0947]|uniref:Hydroxymethylglutaryl-CoA lyase n=1 Tax=Nocardiopsis coralli TaxID=2772213 RepID=A0ABR9P6T2_9ACTN|nr:hydroxymethylglutaryl-CoA lyase [Nocardiopsis coralli]MBE2999405.1 hydroxymethylglutaryl-CoA lyase [Nocardiopsis coralli]